MKTLCNIVLLAAAVGGTAPAAHAQYTPPVRVSSSTLSCTDSEGNTCGVWEWGDDFYGFYAQTDGTCTDSSTSPVYTYPSAVAHVNNDDGWEASVSTSMMIAANGGGGGIDAVDSKVSATVYTYTAYGEYEVDCEYNTLVDQTGDL